MTWTVKTPHRNAWNCWSMRKPARTSNYQWEVRVSWYTKLSWPTVVTTSKKCWNTTLWKRPTVRWSLRISTLKLSSLCSLLVHKWNIVGWGYGRTNAGTCQQILHASFEGKMWETPDGWCASVQGHWSADHRGHVRMQEIEKRLFFIVRIHLLSQLPKFN